MNKVLLGLMFVLTVGSIFVLSGIYSDNSREVNKNVNSANSIQQKEVVDKDVEQVIKVEEVEVEEVETSEPVDDEYPNLYENQPIGGGGWDPIEAVGVEFEPDPETYFGLRTCDMETSSCEVIGVEKDKVAKFMFDQKYLFGFQGKTQVGASGGTTYYTVEGEHALLPIE